LLNSKGFLNSSISFMLTCSELKKISVFACLNDANLMWLSQQGDQAPFEGSATEASGSIRRSLLGRL
jgi:hypothetical protein